MRRFLKHWRASFARLPDGRSLCQASTVILAMCVICGITIMAMSVILRLAENT